METEPNEDPDAELLARIGRGDESAFRTMIARKLPRIHALSLRLLGDSEEVRPGVAELKIELKYSDGEPVIKEISRVSKPGRRIYSKIADLPKVYNGLGIAILSTPRGVMSDGEARAANVGGEVLCRVF